MSQYRQLETNLSKLSTLSDKLIFFSFNGVDVSKHSTGISSMNNLIEEAKDSCVSSLDDDQFYCWFADEVIDKAFSFIENMEIEIEKLESFWSSFEEQRESIQNIPSIITCEFIDNFMLTKKKF